MTCEPKWIFGCQRTCNLLDVDSCVILSGILVDFWDLATQNQVWGLRRVYQFGCKPRDPSCGLITSHAQFQGGHVLKIMPLRQRNEIALQGTIKVALPQDYRAKNTCMLSWTCDLILTLALIELHCAMPPIIWTLIPPFQEQPWIWWSCSRFIYTME